MAKRFAGGPPTCRLPSPTVHFVQGYDEYIVGYSAELQALDAAARRHADFLSLPKAVVRTEWPAPAGAQE